MPPRFVHVFVMTQAGSDETGMPSELPVQTLATRKPVSSKAIDVVTATDVPSRRRGSASPSSPRETRRHADMPGNLLTRRRDRGEPCRRGTFDRLASSWLRAACISAAAPASREKRIRWSPDVVAALQACTSAPRANRANALDRVRVPLGAPRAHDVSTGGMRSGSLYVITRIMRSIFERGEVRTPLHLLLGPVCLFVTATLV